MYRDPDTVRDSFKIVFESVPTDPSNFSEKLSLVGHLASVHLGSTVLPLARPAVLRRQVLVVLLDLGVVALLDGRAKFPP